MSSIQMWFVLLFLWILSLVIAITTKNENTEQKVSNTRARPVFLEGFFSGYIEAGFLAGTIAGILMAYKSALPRSDSSLIILFALIILLQGPAIAERSLMKCLVASVFMLFVNTVCLALNGILVPIREAMPIPVWGLSDIIKGGLLGWEVRVLFAFAFFWVWVGMGMILLQKNVLNIGLYKRFFAAIISVAIGILLVLVVFNISYYIKVSDTLAEPIFSSGRRVVSLLAYGFHFALVPCVIQYCYIRLLRIKLCSSRSSQKMD